MNLTIFKEIFGGIRIPKKAYYPRDWAGIRTPKASGGIGIRDPHKVNLLFLSKLSWRMLSNPDALWVRLLKGKYFPRSHTFHKNREYNISWVWHNIKRGLEVIKQNSVWQVGNGRSINISLDNWIPGL